MSSLVELASGAQPTSLFAAAGNELGHGVSVDPVDDTATHVRHPPVTYVFNDDSHPCFDMQKDRIRQGHCDANCAIDLHALLLSTGPRLEVGGIWQQGE